MLKVPTQDDAFDEFLGALRSGKYKQCRHYMSRMQTTGHLWWKQTDMHYCALGLLQMLSEDKPVRLHMHARWGDKFIDWNDSNRLSFPQIADKLEANRALILSGRSPNGNY